MIRRFQQQVEEEFGNLVNRGEKPCRGRLEKNETDYNGSSRKNNRIPTKTRQEVMF